MKKLNSAGLGAVEVLLVIIIIGLVGGVGYYVYNSQKNTNKSLNNAANSQADPQKTPKQQTADQKAGAETANWKQVTSGKSSFMVKVPDGWNLQNWTSRDYLYADSYNDLTYAAGKSATVANGDTNPIDSGSVRHFSITGNLIAQTQKDSIGNYFGETPQYFGPVSGITGKKYVHIYTEDVDGVKKGDKVYLYRLEGKKTLITVDYYVLNGENDQSSLVEKALKTLSFE